MRLPWLQVNGDGIRRAKMVGVMLGIGERAGVGFVLDLWAAALELAPDGDFSGRVPDAETLVAAAGGDPRTPGADPSGSGAGAGGVVSILQRVGLVATVPELRVRGLDRYTATWRKNRKTGGRPPEPPPDQTRKTQTYTQTQTEILKETSVAQARPEAAVFAYWQTTLGHPTAKFGGKRERAVKARLADGYTVEQLKQAVDGCSRTPHNMGQNDRGERYDDLELICRDTSHVDRFIRNAVSPPRANGTPKGSAWTQQHGTDDGGFLAGLEGP